MFGSTEIAVIAVIVLLLFGSAAIPKLAKSLGQAKSEFKKGLQDGSSEEAKEDQPDHQAG